MDLKTIYDNWFSLDEELLELNNSKKFILKPVFTMGEVSLFISNDLENNRKIYIGFPKDYLNDYELDNVHSISIAVERLEVASKNKDFIVFTLLNSEFDEAFLAFSVSIIRCMYVETNNYEAIKTIEMLLNKYRNLFKKTNNTLSINEEQGLYSELLYLEDLIKEKGEESLLQWIGPERTTHDFYNKTNNESTEVKSTLDQKNITVTITNERQLDCNGLDNLYLEVFVLERNSQGESLKNIITRIATHLSNAKLTTIFLAKLHEAGISGLFYESSYRFLLVDRIKYIVDENFPKITQSTIDSRISYVKYKIQLIDIKREK